MDGLQFSSDPDIIKKENCLTDVFDNLSLDWEKVVGVVGNEPIRKGNEACKIAEEYMGMGEAECKCIISAHRSSKEDVKGYETGIKV